MLRKIDIGLDKNLLVEDPKSKRMPVLKFLADDIPKSPEQAIAEATKTARPLWINSEPLLMGHTEENGTSFLFFLSDVPKKKVLLLEFCDFCLLPSRRSLTYSMEWHKRYGHSGLLIVGVHSPMFEWAKDSKLVADAVRDMGLQFPVVLDNEFNLWRCFENRYWPRRVLLDSKQETQLDVAGEGYYPEFETSIQVLLRALSPGLPCPPVLRPLRKIDDLDYTPPETTDEIFMGLRRNMRIGNQPGFRGENEETAFKDDAQGAYLPDQVYLQGGWVATAESLHGTLHRGDLRLSIRFSGTDVYMVARSRAKNVNDVAQGTKVNIMVDQRPLIEDKVAGTDTVINEARRSSVLLRDPKLYHLATRLAPGSHELTLTIDDDIVHTLEIYGLFFEHNA